MTVHFTLPLRVPGALPISRAADIAEANHWLPPDVILFTNLKTYEAQRQPEFLSQFEVHRQVTPEYVALAFRRPALI